jgi:hypothetical protein
MISRDPAVSNIKQTSSSSSSSKQTVVTKWSGSASTYATTVPTQVDTGLTGTITPSSNDSPILVCVSLPYGLSTTRYSGGEQWTIWAILHSYTAGEDPLSGVPVGSAILANQRGMPTISYSEDIGELGVFSADFITAISVPTSFYVSVTASPGSSPLSVSIGNVGSGYDNKTATYVNNYAVMTIREVDTWNDIYPT